MAKLILRKACYSGIDNVKTSTIKKMSKESKEEVNIRIAKGKEKYANAYLNAKNDLFNKGE